VIVALGLFAMRGWRVEEPGTENGVYHVPGVRAVAALDPTQSRTVRYPGIVSSSDEAFVGALVSGRVARVPITDGQRVEAGAALIYLDDEGYRLALEEAEAELSRARIALAQADRDLERVRALGDAATREELEQRITAFDASDAQVRRASTAVNEAQRRLRETVVRTTRAGVITDVLVETGEVVGAGSPVAVVSTIESYREIELYLPVHHASGISVGDTARFRVASDPSYEFSARVVTISEHGRSSDALFPVRLAVDEDRSRFVAPGTPVSVDISVRSTDGSVRIPAAAVSGIAAGEAYSYRVDGDRAYRVALSSVRVAGDGMLSVDGTIDPGDLVIVSGHDNIADGGSVEVIR
jgi:multidrug efflux system membrane fusion protein